MSKAFVPHSRGIAELFTKSERKKLVVPAFQRGFSWEKQQINAFWDDLISFGDEYQVAPTTATYFLGSIVVTNTDQEIKILDGQQRLATITILLCAIRDKAREVNSKKSNDLARDIQRDYITKENEVENEGDEEISPIYTLTLGELDGPYFEKSIQDDDAAAQEAQLKSHKLISDAQKLLQESVNKITANLSPEEVVKKLAALKNWCTKGMQVVSIEVQNEEDAYHIFETLNDRGMSLSTIDLLINLLLQKSTNANRLVIRQNWNDIIENFGKKDINRFLRHVWISEFGDLKNKSLYKAIKEYLDSNKVTSSRFTTSCLANSTIYLNLLEQKEVPDDTVSDLQGVVKHLGMTYTLPLLLAAKKNLSDKNFSKLVATVATTCARCYITNFNPTTLEEIFYQAAKVLTNTHESGITENNVLRDVMDVLVAANVDDNAILLSLRRENDLSNAAALWILKSIVDKSQSSTGEFTVSNSNLEHIFPQKAKVESWPDLQELRPYLQHLGNLTLLQRKLNDAAANSDYSTKATNHFKKSEIVITNTIPTSFPTWTKASVLARAQQLGAMFNSTFNQVAKPKPVKKSLKV